MTKTITINVPKPGDSLPFEVLRNGDTVLEFNDRGTLTLCKQSDDLLNIHIAKLLGIPDDLDIDLNPTVAEVPE